MDGRTLSPIFNLYVFRPGRAAFAADQVAELAGALSLTRIVAAAGRASTTAREQIDIELRWVAARDATQAVHTDMALSLDRDINTTVTGLHRTVEGMRDAFAPGSPQAEHAAHLLQRTLPAGPGAVITLPFEEQLTTVEEILARCTGELAEAVDALGLKALVERLADLNTRFAAEVRARHTPDAPTFDQVTAARHATTEALAGLVATIVGEFPGSSDEHADQRAHLLTPILEQNAAIQQSRKRRRTATDIDPQTGQEQPDTSPVTDVTPPVADPQPEPVG